MYRSVPGFVSVLSEYLSFLAKTMRQIATDLDLDFRSLLDGLEHPAILLTPDYQIVASNQRYQQSFGDVPVGDHCFRVSHGYDKPCDQAGESCPVTSGLA